jgi:hypothetical protein
MAAAHATRDPPKFLPLSRFSWCIRPHSCHSSAMNRHPSAPTRKPVRGIGFAMLLSGVFWVALAGTLGIF